LPALAGSALHITTPAQDPLSSKNGDGFLDQVVSNAFQRMGYRLHVQHLPAERALLNANNGIDDGALNRIGGLSGKYPNLIQTGEPTWTMEFVGFSKKKGITIKNWDSLRPYTVGLINGWKILEIHIPEGTTVVKVRNPQQLFYLLEKDRIDIALFGKWQGLHYLKQDHIKGITVLSPPLAQKEMFVYFNKKHKHLIPKYDAVLRKMKADGTWTKIFNTTLEPLAH